MSTTHELAPGTSYRLHRLLLCEDCGVEHLGDFSHDNQWGQVVYLVEGVCEHNDYLTDEVAVD